MTITNLYYRLNLFIKGERKKEKEREGEREKEREKERERERKREKERKRREREKERYATVNWSIWPLYRYCHSANSS